MNHKNHNLHSCRDDKDANTEDGCDQARGRAFADWLKGALTLKQMTAKGLSDESKRVLREPMSPGHLGTLLKGGCKTGTRKVMRPHPDFIERVAQLTGADKQTGLQAAGYWPPPPALSGCRVRYVLIPEDCPEETEQVLTQLAHLLAKAGQTTRMTNGQANPGKERES